MGADRARSIAARILFGGALALATVTCDKELPCRPGTVFISVSTGPFVNASTVEVEVYIDGVGPQEKSLPIPAGARGGGIEVQFRNPYPAGTMIRIDLTLKANGATIASHREDVTLRGDCASVDAVFVAGDGLTGAGGAGGGSAGAGGTGGGAAGRGGSGGAGTAGTAGTAATAGTSGTAGTGGSIVLVGTAGSTGGGVAGRGGAGGGAGTGGGAGGRGGVGGTAGTMSRGGTSGTAGTSGGRGGTGGGVGGRGGTGPMCVPTTEFCYNGADDDCDGQTDCADTDCTPIAQCVPLDAAGARIGVMLPATATCPPNYTDMTALNQTLSGGVCAGCSCRPPTVTSCSATIASYGNAADCANANNPGTPEITFSSTQACTTPNWVGTQFTQVYGIQVGPFQPALSGLCTPQGTGTPGPPTWATSGRFCAATMVGGGCPNGLSCAPIATPSKCVMWEGLHTCQAGSTTTYWYTGASDTRTCGACTCGGPTGQSCSGMRVQVGTDYTCSPNITATIASGARYCYPGNGVYSPGIVFTGTPTQPTCSGSAPTMGTLTPTGQRTLCCL
jgi:hypothetical protein